MPMYKADNAQIFLKQPGHDDTRQHAPLTYRGVDANRGPAHIRAKLAASSICPHGIQFLKSCGRMKLLSRPENASKTHKTRSKSKASKCGVRIRLLNLLSHEAGRLLLEAKTLLDAHKTVEATSRIERLQALDEATKRLASEVCKPD